MDPVDLRVDWCSVQAARYAVEHWHYSRTMPVAKSNYVGAWENGHYVGAVIYGMGATGSLAKFFGVGVFEVSELQRVALSKHDAPTSQIVAAATKLVVAHNPGLKVLYSCADSREGHVGTIY